MKILNPLILAAFAMSGLAHATEVDFEKDPSLPLVYLNVAVKAGSVQDPAQKIGLTNFMGEMLLRGTKSRKKEQIDLAIDQIGATLEVETRAEALVIRGAVLASQLDRFLEIVRDIVVEPSFPDEEIAKLKSEMTSRILEELGRDPTLASRKFAEFLFKGHPYGNPVNGKIKDIEGLTREDLVNQYDMLVQNQYLLILGSGDADPEKIENWAHALGEARPDRKEFKKIGPPSRPQDSNSRRLLLIDKPERTQTQILGGEIGIIMTDPRFFPLYLANYAFGGPSFASRLMVEIRVKRGWSYGANSNFRFGTQPRLWQFHLFPASKDAAPALAQTLQMAEELKTKGLNKTEFDFSKDSLINSSGFMFDTPKKRVENKLLEKTLGLPDGFMESYAQNLKKVSLEQVNESLKDFLQPDKTAVAVVCTAKDLKEKLAQAAKVPVDQVQVIPYTQE